MRFGAVALLAATLLVACGDDDDAETRDVNGDLELTEIDESTLRDYVEADMAEYGYALGCMWNSEIHPGNDMEGALEFLDVPQGFDDPWSPGQLGGWSDVQFGTVYDESRTTESDQLERVEGEGYVCLVPE